MSRRITLSSGRTPLRVSQTVLHLRRVLLMAGATLVLALPASTLLASQSASAGGGSFVGNWKVSGGYLGFTIKSENRHTGVCTGTTPDAQYHLTACRVAGNKYSFTITEGLSYRSRNTGTFSGNRASGSFKDSNGTVARYSAVR